MKKILFVLFMSIVPLTTSAQQQGERKERDKNDITAVQGQRQYFLDVNDGLDLSDMNDYISQVQRSIASSDRLALSMFANEYKSLSTGKLATTVSNFMDLGLHYLTSAVKSHRTDWQQAVQNECKFQKSIKMLEEIPDFYKSTTSEGALDLTDINFRGFTCRQHITTEDGKQIKVMEAEFIIDTTKAGIQRILHHSKFQMKLKSLEFYPYLCEIPNDSISDIELRLPFDFQKRKDLTVRLNATIKSSWVNEAIMITSDQTLGTFNLEFRINESSLDSTGCFRYVMPEDPQMENQALRKMMISMTGESFMVPRSFIGNIDGRPYWGTGDYKIEATLTESCRINEQYYTTVDKDGKVQWDRSKWHPEWKKIKKRDAYKRKMKQPFMQTWEKVKTEWTGGKWVTEIITPSTKILLNEGSSALNELLSIESSKSTTGAAASGQAPKK